MQLYVAVLLGAIALCLGAAVISFRKVASHRSGARVQNVKRRVASSIAAPSSRR